MPVAGLFACSSSSVVEVVWTKSRGRSSRIQASCTFDVIPPRLVTSITDSIVSLLNGSLPASVFPAWIPSSLRARQQKGMMPTSSLLRPLTFSISASRLHFTLCESYTGKSWRQNWDHFLLVELQSHFPLPVHRPDSGIADSSRCYRTDSQYSPFLQSGRASESSSEEESVDEGLSGLRIRDEDASEWESVGRVFTNCSGIPEAHPRALSG